jgi:hypothetical protein
MPALEEIPILANLINTNTSPSSYPFQVRVLSAPSLRSVLVVGPTLLSAGFAGET